MYNSELTLRFNVDLPCEKTKIENKYSTTWCSISQAGTANDGKRGCRKIAVKVSLSMTLQRHVMLHCRVLIRRIV